MTNDDGIDADGIKALAETFCEKHDVLVVAPDSQRSASSHSLSSMKNITYSAVSGFPVRAFSCSGTPADCVKLAVLHLMENPPDVVISGINNGTNLGSDIMYSGTVSAAYEGNYLGIKSVAVSASANSPYEKLLETARFVEENLSEFISVPPFTVVNVNYPLRKPLAGVKYTKAGVNLYLDGFVKTEDGWQLVGKPKPLPEEEKDCDVYWYGLGYITVTPIHNDRNDYDTLAKLRNKNR